MSQSSQNISGHIDHLEGGYVSGWTARIGDNTPINVAIYNQKGAFLGQGIANTYRDDLRENGINDGEHGFSIQINTELLSSKDKLVLKEVTTNTPIAAQAFAIELEESNISVRVTHVVGNKLSFSAWNKSAPWRKTLQFRIGDIHIGQYVVDSADKQVFGHIWVPAKFLNGVQQRVDIFAHGDALPLGGGEFTSEPVLTPWQYLKHSYGTPGYVSKPPVADNRYESLNFQLKNLQLDNQTGVSLETIQTVHQVLVEGYDGRKQFPKFTLPKFENPEVSIIVPAYNKFSLTYHCIASIALAYNKTSYEVILADDCSTDETAKAEGIIENLVISRNEENLRFLRSCNAATAHCKGKYIVFLNNDTEVTSFWLDELVSQFERDPDTGLTGSKLVNLDGTLQEAGGIVWGNGEPWNAGRNDNPFAPEWSYVREVDYVTGAAMCIRADVWNEVGKFSEEYAPCYYEDADLAFKVRHAGYKVVFTPHSKVIHFEGQSHGTDVTKGLKKYQVLNETTFRRKWFKQFKSHARPSLQALNLEKDRNIEQRILVLDYATPMQGMDAGSYAAIQEIKLMIALGFKVTFVPENLADMGKFTQQLQRLGVEVLLAPFYYSLQHVLEQRLEEMDAVYITRYGVAKKYIDQIKESGKPVVFNNADLHFLRELRAALANNAQEELDQALLTREEELDVCRKADAILTYNSTEHAVISSHILKSDSMHITPWVLEPHEPGPGYKSREGIAFLGGYNHKPNVEAVEFMVNKVMPLLHSERPDIKFYVYGSKMPKEFEAFETDNVVVKGFAETLDGVYHDHRIFVAPLLSGAGIKGKVLDAMAYSSPTVLTDVAAEGTGLTNGINTLIANNAEEWVEAIIKLYDDEVLWNRFAENSLLLAKENYSFENGVKRFRQIFESVGVFSSR